MNQCEFLKHVLICRLKVRPLLWNSKDIHTDIIKFFKPLFTTLSLYFVYFFKNIFNKTLKSFNMLKLKLK